MIQGIVFDMGGVLIDLHYERCVAAFKAIGFEQICDYLDPCHQKGIYGDMESGKVSADEFYEFVLTKCNPGTTRADILPDFPEEQGLQDFHAQQQQSHYDAHLRRRFQKGRNRNQ